MLSEQSEVLSSSSCLSALYREMGPVSSTAHSEIVSRTRVFLSQGGGGGWRPIQPNPPPPKGGTRTKINSGSHGAKNFPTFLNGENFPAKLPPSEVPPPPDLYDVSVAVCGRHKPSLAPLSSPYFLSEQNRKNNVRFFHSDRLGAVARTC